jgi:hypothetical protein
VYLYYERSVATTSRYKLVITLDRHEPTVNSTLKLALLDFVKAPSLFKIYHVHKHANFGKCVLTSVFTWTEYEDYCLLGYEAV